MPRMLILLALLACDGRSDKAETGSIDPDADTDGFPRSEDCDDDNPEVNPDAIDACENGVDDNCDGEDAVCAPPCVDSDGDGYYATEDCDDVVDCDDENASTSPAVPEACDGIDNDCDGEIDEVYVSSGVDTGGETGGDTGGDTGAEGAETVPDEALNYTPFYLDADDDGFGDVTVVEYACAAPDGYVEDATDCDDLSTDDHPGAEELCDDENDDDDCDGLSDDADGGVTDYEVLYNDDDGDGFGASLGYDTRYDLCDPPTCDPLLEPCWSRDNLDCDDLDALINPDATEICDDANTDEDCDGGVDDLDDSVDNGTMSGWYGDADADTFVLSDLEVTACDEPEAYSAKIEGAADDCDDEDATTWPGAPDYCDGVNHDCDDEIDEDDSIGVPTWYMDKDGDDYGDPHSSAYSCSAPDDYVADSTDCDDTDGTIYPDADEYCNTLDDDCDGKIDDEDVDDIAIDATVWFPDDDTDGYGWVGDPRLACEMPEGHVEDSTDCDDHDIDHHAFETYYYDRDGDDYGDSDTTREFCGAPTTYWKAYDGDCDLDEAAIHPGAEERCNDIDDDCDGLTDDEDSYVAARDLTLWYKDTDDDGYGSEASGYSYTCDAPSGYVSNGEDCNNTNAAINPGESEICNDVDDDCDDEVDEGLTTYTWSRDDDGDGYGDIDGAASKCDAPSAAYVKGAQDCDDGDANINPGETELCDGIDADCSGEEEQCMYVGSTEIQLEPTVNGTVTVAYPELVDDTLAFIAVGKLIEHGDDQCDYKTTITDEGGSYSFAVDLEHCGYGHYDSAYGFEANAIVLGSIGEGASFTSFDMEATGGEIDTATLELSSADASEGSQLCAVYSADGQGDTDNEWSCSLELIGESLAGELYSGWGDGSNLVGARFMNIVPGDNVELTVKSFSCDTGSTASVSHTISSDKGEGHQAYVALQDLSTSTGKHMSFESECNLSGSTYTCDMICYGSGSGFKGAVLFVDGQFE